MLDTVVLIIKRRKLMRQFRCNEVKYHAERLGETMASADNDSERAYQREKLQEAIQTVCAKKDIRDEDLSLIEDDLNDYINGLVGAAYQEESHKQQMREIVDARIKIKRVEGLELPGQLPSNAS